MQENAIALGNYSIQSMRQCMCNSIPTIYVIMKNDLAMH